MSLILGVFGEVALVGFFEELSFGLFDDGVVDVLGGEDVFWDVGEELSGLGEVVGAELGDVG